ncbi:hypothetical protein ACIP5N_21345 [Streptomyces sp. NPDC088768]|uniref:hypothetical protein n=1 Tax=Streptomyces sp. NPDC088768 TaxID=3365894 RepID=UPI00381F8A1C
MDYFLVSAAAQAAGPCPPGDEAAWGRRVQALATDLHMIGAQVAQDVARLEGATRFAALLEAVEIEASSRRGLLTLRTADGGSEHIRTEQRESERGRAMIERARSLTGRWVLVYRYNESASRQKSVRMVAHLMDLGEGALAVKTAKSLLLEDAGGDTSLARAAWEGAGLPDTGTVTAEALEQARAKLR